jgi:hypothetical protein
VRHRIPDIVPHRLRMRLSAWHPGRARRWRKLPGIQRVERGSAVLTFDDGPAPDATPLVLSALEDAQVQATTQQRPHWFRPPYGRMSESSRVFAKSSGSALFTGLLGEGHSLSVDWEDVSEQAIVTEVRSGLSAGSIVLLHDTAQYGRRATANATVDCPGPTDENPQGVCLDKAYDHDFIRELLEDLDFTAHIRSRGEEALELRTDLGHRARRWVVERIHSWINRYRAPPQRISGSTLTVRMDPEMRHCACQRSRHTQEPTHLRDHSKSESAPEDALGGRALLIRWSKKPVNHDALLKFCFALITWQQMGVMRLSG